MKVIKESALTAKMMSDTDLRYKGHIIRKLSDFGYEIIDPKFDMNEPVYDYVANVQEAKNWIDYEVENADSLAEDTDLSVTDLSGATVDVTETDVEDAEETPKSPSLEENGIAAFLNRMIVGEWDTIRDYNDLIVNAQLQGMDGIVTVVRDIVNEENTHVGQLQQALASLSPNVQLIADGEKEGAEQMAVPTAQEEFVTDKDGNVSRQITDADLALSIPASDVDDEI